MPHQVAEEFMRNRVSIIIDNQNKYDQIKKDTEEHIVKMSKLFNISENDPECVDFKKKLNDWTDKFYNSNLLVKNSANDELVKKILNIFNGKTGTPFSNEQLKKIEQEGEDRYNREIPPGYKDASKKKNDNLTNNMYGDLIVWKQILEFAKTHKKNIIYVTNDQKEDWWNNVKGQTIGPRVELRKEFLSETNNKIFHMYTLDNFLKYSTENIDDKILQEVKIIPEEFDITLDNNYQNKLEYIKELNDRFSLLKLRSQRIQNEYERIEQELELLRKRPLYALPHSKEYYHRIMNRKDFLLSRLMKMNEEIDKLTYEINKLDNKTENDE